MIELESLLKTGMYKVKQRNVEKRDTGASVGSGALPDLLAAPAFAAMMIDAAVETVEDYLPKGFVSVGHKMEFTHTVPTVIGMNVQVRATLADVREDRMIFNIVAYDDHGEIGYGKHERVVVNRDKLIQRAYERAGGQLSHLLLSKDRHLRDYPSPSH